MTPELTRRALLGRAGLLGAAALLPAAAFAQIDTSDLAPITGGAAPITAAERAARLAKAQALMRERGMRAVLIEPGASLLYFTGVKWGRSERLTAAVLPDRGDPLIVTPFFEEPSVRESLAIPAELRVWQEDESPAALIADWLRAGGRASGPIGIE